MPFDLALLALKPRQVVLLSKPAMKTIETLNPTSDHKSLLLLSVARFLELNGFPKTLKRFLSEANIKGEALKGSTDLEEVYSKYIEICDETKTKTKDQDKKVVTNDEVKKSEQQPEESDKDKKNKKKKKKDLSSEPKPVADTTDEKSKDLNLEEKTSGNDAETPVEEKSSKSKSKKKKKNDLNSGSDPLADTTEEKSKDVKLEEKIACDNVETPLEGKSSKSKSKKKKKVNLDSDGTSVNGTTIADSKISDANASDEDSKSKKRKREVPEENGSKPEDKIDVDESKHRKVDEASENTNGMENGNGGKSAEKSAVRKSGKTKLNGSAEPKTAIAFQRVKVDDVVFTDERLKDNSYWAKSGADTGYGAKAEEVLGQVRGRDFRHEKTKKKRGSYRGGQIDMHSHSVKFNYSDEE